MATKAFAQLIETRLSSSLHKGCPDKLSRHTLRSLSRILKWVESLWEIIDERLLGVAYLSPVSVGFLQCSNGGNTVMLSWRLDLMLQWWLCSKWHSNHCSCKTAGGCVRQRVMMQFSVISSYWRYEWWARWAIDVDVWIGKVPSTTPVSECHRFTYQRGFGALRKVCYAQWAYMVWIECSCMPWWSSRQ